MGGEKKQSVVREEPSPWKAEGKEVLAGFSGAFIFGVPLLFTMEVWWQGARSGPLYMAAALGVTYLLLILLIRATGFKNDRFSGWGRVLTDAAEALAIGEAAAAASLLLIGSLDFSLGFAPALGRIVLEGAPFGLGVGISNYLLRPSGRQGPEEEENKTDEKKGKGEDRPWRGTLANLGAAALGAVVIASVIAPSQEVPLVAGRLTTLWLLVLLAASLLLSYLIVFVADFISVEARASHPGILRHPVSETVAALLVSLAMSTGMLLLFQRLDFGEPPSTWVAYILVLNLPASIGGATGRLVL